jgi:predicted SnoaL-like aldol condensation-catalyzing enzyme
MALIKETVVDKIEVLENNAIQVRSVVRVLEDGEVLSSSYHRHVLQPGDDLTNEVPKVVALANAAWA